MRVEILCTGDEILTGKTINTNYSHIARRLVEAGVAPHALDALFLTHIHSDHLADVADRIEESASGFGKLTAVRHSAVMSETPPRWERPSVPLGTHPPAWP